MHLRPTEYATTKICITNLTLPHPVLAPDVWGKEKEQPAVLNITLTLRGNGFGSSGNLDILDDSTIHYGLLAKKIRAACTAGLDLKGLCLATETAVLEMGRKRGNTQIIGESRIEVGLCKASMFGEDLKFVMVRHQGVDGRCEGLWTRFELKGMKIMVLVGVNAYERQAKQPLVIDLGLWYDKGPVVGLFSLEKTVVEVSCSF